MGDGVNSGPVLEVADLHVRYGGFEAVKGVSFALRRGGILGIVGESGSGKSTIARTLIGLHKDYTGSITFNVQRSTFNVKPRLAMIFQDAVGSLNPRMTIGQTLAETLAVCGGPRGKPLGAEQEGPRGKPLGAEQEGPRGKPLGAEHGGSRGKPLGAEHGGSGELGALLARVGLSSAVLDQYPRELSGGQCQRVSIARALATRPDILIADEPVSALDVSVQARVLNLLRDLRRELGLTILLIAHDLAVVKNVCDGICVMEKGMFVDCGEAAAVFDHPQSEYTKKLLTAVPRIVI